MIVMMIRKIIMSSISISIYFHILVMINKAFVGLGSCDNVQTERIIFEYANWPRLQLKRTGQSSWSVQLVCPAGPSSRPIYTLHLTHSILHNAPCTLLLTYCILHIECYTLHLTHCTLHGASYILHKSFKSLSQTSLKNL